MAIIKEEIAGVRVAERSLEQADEKSFNAVFRVFSPQLVAFFLRHRGRPRHRRRFGAGSDGRTDRFHVWSEIILFQSLWEGRQTLALRVHRPPRRLT
jgi:hypothetical protein